MGFVDANSSPIGLLANAFRRLDAGIKSLFVDRTLAKAMAERFRKGEVEFLNDDKWWEAAQEADKLRATGGAGVSPEVDAGNTPSEDAADYGPVSGEGQFTKPVLPTPTPQSVPLTQNSKLDDLITASSQIASWSGSYTYGHAPPLTIKTWSLNSGNIFSKGDSVPCLFHADGIDCDFIFNPRHPFLAQFPVGPRELMGLYLAEKFKARDNLTDIGKVYADVLQPKLQDVRIDRAGLQEKAAGMFDRLRELMISHLKGCAAAVLGCVHESSGETEETVNSMLSNSNLVMLFQDRKSEGLDALQHVPHRTLLRIVDRFPEELFDGNVFSAYYSKINLADGQATQRTRNESKERILTFLKDALWVLSPSSSSLAGGRAKDELARCSHSINFLSQELSD